MTDEQKVKIKEKFKEGKYDVISFILDNDLIKINLSNYEKFCDEVVNIFNEVRINRSIIDEEVLYPYEELFANDFHRSVYRAIKRNEIIDELPDDALNKLVDYYRMIKDISSMGKYMEEENENSNSN